MDRRQAGRAVGCTLWPAQGLWLPGWARRARSWRLTVEASGTARGAPREAPTRIGIYLSFGDGALSFYDTPATPTRWSCSSSSMSALRRARGPFFDVCWHDKGKNAQPLLLVGPGPVAAPARARRFELAVGFGEGGPCRPGPGPPGLKSGRRGWGRDSKHSEKLAVGMQGTASQGLGW